MFRTASPTVGPDDAASAPAPARRRRSALALLAVLLMAAASSGCGGYGRRYDVYGGTLEVVNHPASFDIIDVVEISQPFGPVESYVVLLLPGETFEIDLYPDTYDVDVFWNGGLVEGVTVDVFDDLVTTVVFQN